MRSNDLRRAVATLRGRGGAAGRHGSESAATADWRAIVARTPTAPASPASPTATAPASPAATAPAAGARRRRPDRPATLTAFVLGLTLLAQAGVLLFGPPAPDAASMADPVTVAGPPAAVRVAAPPARRSPPPTTISIKRIGVRSSLARLGVRRDGTIETPEDYGQAGWYRNGARPGEAGPAVIVGHVDSTDGPAVFFRLRELVRGDRVDVRRTDGSVVTYAVTAVRTYPKSRFPTKDVYGATKAPTLRLVTCGGAFDTKSRSYRDNVVIFADLVAPRPSGGTR